MVSILNLLGTVAIPAMTEPFVAKDKFRKGSEIVKFHGFYGNFWDDFLFGFSKIEELRSERVLRYGNLTKSSFRGSIIKELGGEAKAETTLFELYDLFTRQGNGEEGDLLTDGYANIFYVRNISGVLCAVFVFWRDGGWRVRNYSVKYSSSDSTCRRIFFLDY